MKYDLSYSFLAIFIFLSAIKKCAAEATHQKTHSSACCNTNFYNTSYQYVKIEHAFLSEDKNTHR